MADKDEQQLMIDASVLYYLEGKTQNEVAKALFLSRPKISRLLKKARDLHIVDITINYNNEQMEELQGEIRRTFNVPNVVIVKTLSDEQETINEVGKAAAKELGMVLHDDMTLGISWGKHVRVCTSYLKKHSYSGIRIVELFGAISYDMNKLDMLSIGRSISSKLDGKLYPLPSPIYIHDAHARKAIVETPLIRDTLAMIEGCDLILSGIGAVDSETSTFQTLWDNHVESNIKEQVINHGGIGFILAHFFDQKGEFLDIPANDSVIGIRTDTIKEKKIFAIAAGEKKAKAIFAALRGGLVHTIVSDEDTLRLVLKYGKKLKEIEKGGC
ncbi:sugar-binding domain-containing protein [Vallitaleaceae bacterium 9-2]